MPTRKRTNRTPPPSRVAKNFKSVDQYLNWIMHSSTAISQNKIQERRKSEEILCSVAASILAKAIWECPNILRYFDIDDSVPLRIAVKDMLVREKDGEYRLRLYLKHLGPNRSYQMLVGYPHNVPKGNAVLQLNESLTLVERETIKRLMPCCLEGITLSPDKISKWVSPALVKALKMINKKIIRKYSIRSIAIHSNDGLTAFLACSAKQGIHSFSVKLNIDIGVLIASLPKNFKLQHPFPKHYPFPQKGREMIREIRDGFEYGSLQVCLHVPLVKQKSVLPNLDSGGSLVHMAPRRARTIINLQDMFSRSNTTLETNSSLYSSIRLWNVDYDVIERIIAAHVKQQSSFRMIQEAFKLYNVLVHRGNSNLPALNERTKRALALWMYKQSGQNMENFNEAFIALLELASSCFEKKFCPSFCQPTLNTIDHVDEPSSDDDDSSVDEDYDDEKNEEQKTKNSSPITKLLKIIQENNVKKAADFIQIY